MVFSEVEKLKKQLNCSMDVVVREVSCGGREINLIFIKSMIDENFFISGILSPIMDFGSRQSKISSGRPFTIDNLLDEVLKTMEVKKVSKEDAEKELASNKVLLFLEGEEDV